MPLNPTENYLRDRRDQALINFAGAVVISDTYLTGPGNYAGDGYPMPAPGKIMKLYVYDGYLTRNSDVIVGFNAGDRISLFAQYDDPWFLVYVRINGVNTGAYCQQLASYATLRASLLVRLDVY